MVGVFFYTRSRRRSSWEREDGSMENRRDKEIREAREAGERALQSLYAAREKLASARRWGIWDLIGGGLFANVVKHTELDHAAGYLETAKQDLALFQRELKDVDVPMDIRIDIGSFLAFADFFLDGLVADYLVQSRIADAREQVEDAIQNVERVLQGLKSCS